LLRKKLKTLLKLYTDQWEKALAYAPSVSMEYWRTLALRYAENLAEQDDEQAGYYYILAKDNPKVLFKKFEDFYSFVKAGSRLSAQKGTVSRWGAFGLSFIEWK
jgi:hypothetical protein